MLKKNLKIMHFIVDSHLQILQMRLYLDHQKRKTASPLKPGNEIRKMRTASKGRGVERRLTMAR